MNDLCFRLGHKRCCLSLPTAYCLRCGQKLGRLDEASPTATTEEEGR